MKSTIKITDSLVTGISGLEQPRGRVITQRHMHMLLAGDAGGEGVGEAGKASGGSLREEGKPQGRASGARLSYNTFTLYSGASQARQVVIDAFLARWRRCCFAFCCTGSFYRYTCLYRINILLYL